MTTLFKKFTRDDSGAVTVDWVVLTAALIFFGFVIGTMVSEATIDSGEAIGETVGAL